MITELQNVGTFLHKVKGRWEKGATKKVQGVEETREKEM
jgi:hypothetical protein